MARHISSSQFRSKVRQAQSKLKRDIQRLERESKAARNKRNQKIRSYNQKVRTHNARARSNRQRLKNELVRLARNSTSTTVTRRHVVYRTSVQTLHQSYDRLDQYAVANELDDRYGHLLDLSERETANSLEVTNRILGDEEAGDTQTDALEDSELLDKLRLIAPELDDRWRGAIFALNPSNPDAARHFCTSAREIIAGILDIKAPDEDVFALLPGCEKTPQGNATRRSKIKYFLHRHGIAINPLEDFVENDLENIVQLFGVFNEGTHGSAGTFSLRELRSIRKRVEDGITFLAEIIGD